MHNRSLRMPAFAWVTARRTCTLGQPPGTSVHEPLVAALSERAGVRSHTGTNYVSSKLSVKRGSVQVHTLVCVEFNLPPGPRNRRYSWSTQASVTLSSATK